MYSKNPFGIFSKFVQLANFFGLTRFAWDREHRGLVYRQSRRRRVWEDVQLILLSGYISFLAYQSLLLHLKAQAQGTEDTNALRKKIQTFYVAGVWILLSSNHYVSIGRGGEFLRLVNGIKSFFQSSPTQQGQAEKASRRYMKLVAITGAFVTLSTAATVFISPESPRVLTRLVSKPRQTPSYVKCLLAILHLIITGFHMFAWWLQSSMVIIYADGVSNGLKALAPSAPNCTKERFAKRYRAFSVLGAHFASLYGSWMIFIQVGMLTYMILNIYQAVAFERWQSLALALAGGSCIRYFLGQAAQVHEQSLGLLGEWTRKCGVRRNNDEAQWFRRLLRSCRTVNVPVGSLFYVDRGLILTSLSIITNTSASLVLGK